MNASSKKAENRAAAISLCIMFYSFWRVHRTLRVAPVMEAGLADRLWTVEELVALLPETTLAKSTKDRDVLREDLGERD